MLSDARLKYILIGRHNGMDQEQSCHLLIDLVIIISLLEKYSDWKMEIAD